MSSSKIFCLIILLINCPSKIFMTLFAIKNCGIQKLPSGGRAEIENLNVWIYFTFSICAQSPEVTSNVTKPLASMDRQSKKGHTHIAHKRLTASILLQDLVDFTLFCLVYFLSLPTSASIILIEPTTNCNIQF